MTTNLIKKTTSAAACGLLVVGGIVACSSDNGVADPEPEATEQVSQDLSNPSGLTGRWRFNEGAGQRALDSSGNALHGRLGSDPLLADANDPNWVAVIPGAGVPLDVPPYALSFNSSAPDWVRVPSFRENFAKLETANVSVELWVRAATNPGTNAYMIAKGANGCVSSSYALYNTADGVKFYITDTTGAVKASPPVAQASVWNGAWHHFVGTYDGANVKLYFDSALVGQTASTGAIKYNMATNDHLFIGVYKGSCTIPFNGRIDDVRIYDKALSGAEVAQRFSGLVTPDADTDGTVDASDLCAGTVGGLANNKGCSVAQCCPATDANFAARPAGACPKSTSVTNWSTHGQYVSCVSAVASQLLNEGKISLKQQSQLTSAAGGSDIGKN